MVSKNISHQLFLFFIASIFALLSACAQKPTSISEPQIIDHTTDKPSSSRLDKYQQAFQQINYRPKEYRNAAYLELAKSIYADFYYTPETMMLDLAQIEAYQQRLQTSQYQETEQLLAQILDTLDSDSLSTAEYNDFRLLVARLSLLRKESNKAQVLLSEEYPLINPQQSALLTWLNAECYQQLKENKQAFLGYLDYAVLVMGKTKDGNETSGKFPYYLMKIWENLEKYQKSLKNEQTLLQLQITDKPYLMQYHGWLRLSQIIANQLRKQSLEQEIKQWRAIYPQHMANNDFLNALYQQRIKSLLDIQQIALLFDQTERYERAINNIVNGIIAAHYQQPHHNSVKLRRYAFTNAENIQNIYQQAVNDGADVVIGPLNKTAVQQLSLQSEFAVPTLVLNQIPVEQAQQSKNLFQFALLPEDEIQAIVERAKKDGHHNAVIIVPQSAWGDRIANAFTKKWQHAGGNILTEQRILMQGYDFKQPITELLAVDTSYLRKLELANRIGFSFKFKPRIRQDIDMIFIAAYPQQARQIPLQIRFHHGMNIPIYALSQLIEEPFNQLQNNDLNGIIYSDMPWLMEPNMVAISNLSQEKNATLKRLFSLGVDSYRILPYLNLLQTKQISLFHGEVADLRIDSQGKIERDFQFSKIISGKQRAYP